MSRIPTLKECADELATLHERQNLAVSELEGVRSGIKIYIISDRALQQLIAVTIEQWKVNRVQ